MTLQHFAWRMGRDEQRRRAELAEALLAEALAAAPTYPELERQAKLADEVIEAAKTPAPLPPSPREVQIEQIRKARELLSRVHHRQYTQRCLLEQ